MRILLLLILLATEAICAPMAIVNNANDGGDGSLRQAIIDANGGSNYTIVFNIGGTNVHTIAPLTPLPPLTAPITVNGYSQPGSVQNSLILGDNASPRIELSGENITNGVGLDIAANGCTVRGLVINGFPGGGIL